TSSYVNRVAAAHRAFASPAFKVPSEIGCSGRSKRSESEPVCQRRSMKRSHAMTMRTAQSYAGKRAFDLAVASAACLAFAPLAAGIALASWLEDGGPTLFAQSRVGRHRQPFMILKFRSMREGGVTRVGSWLRRTGIDELPQ